MSTRQIICAILALSMVLGLFNAAPVQSVSADAETPSQQAQEDGNAGSPDD